MTVTVTVTVMTMTETEVADEERQVEGESGECKVKEKKRWKWKWKWKWKGRERGRGDGGQAKVEGRREATGKDKRRITMEVRRRQGEQTELAGWLTEEWRNHAATKKKWRLSQIIEP